MNTEFKRSWEMPQILLIKKLFILCLLNDIVEVSRCVNFKVRAGPLLNKQT